MRINKDTQIDELAPIREKVALLKQQMDTLDYYLTMMRNEEDEDDPYKKVQDEMDILNVFNLVDDIKAGLL